jgi:hypothetical protein
MNASQSVEYEAARRGIIKSATCAAELRAVDSAGPQAGCLVPAVIQRLLVEMAAVYAVGMRYVDRLNP